MNIIESLRDGQLLGQFIEDPETWGSWFTALKAFYGLPYDSKKELSLYRKCTGRTKWPRNAAKEGTFIIGRRSGKTITSAFIGCYEAAFKDHNLGPAEIGNVIIVSPTRTQSRIIKRYLSNFFHENRLLKATVVRETSEELELSNRVNILVLAGDFRSLRGYTAVCCIVDELAFFYSEGSRPDYEVLRALRPTLATTGGPLISISSPYTKAGSLYSSYRNHWGKDGDDTLIWQGDSITMNPTLNKDVIERAKQEDPEGSIAEWGGNFRSDIESFVSREAVEAVTIPGRYELPPLSNIAYSAFCDPSGGSRDSFTLAISHKEGELRILDSIREQKPPFSPEQITEEFAALLKSYRVTRIRGDRYGGEFPRELFRKHGIVYEVADKAKSDIYKEFLPLVNSGQCELLDHKKMINQLLTLERRTARGGRDSIDHPPGGHDDLINAAAGALVGLEGKKIVRSL